MDARLVPGEANDLSGDTGTRDVSLEWSTFAPKKARQSLVLANVRNRKMLAVHHDVDAGFQEADSKETFREVLQSVAAFESERRHGTGYHNRNLQIRKCAFQIA